MIRRLISANAIGGDMDIRLTELIGRPVCTTEGNTVGQVVDLVARLGEDFPEIVAVLVKRGRTASGRASYIDIENLSSEEILLSPGAEITANTLTDARELRLARDVLDTQVFDIIGRRLVRVGDVLLDADSHQIRVVGVDVGPNAILRRLGLGWVARRMAVTLITWPELHLTSGQGLTSHLQAGVSTLHRLTPEQLAALLAYLPTHDAARVLSHLSPAPAAASLRVSHRHRGARLLHAVPEHLAAAVINHLPVQDATSILRHMPTADVTEVLRHADQKHAQALTEALSVSPRSKLSEPSTPSRYPHLRPRRLRLPPRASRRKYR